MLIKKDKKKKKLSVEIFWNSSLKVYRLLWSIKWKYGLHWREI